MREDLEFPDEVETPRDMSARERFIKYRGLESFRSSPWNLNENLPEEYSKIFHIPRFEHYRKRVVADAALKDVAVEAGQYVTLHVQDVPNHLYGEHMSINSPLVVFGLLLHEAKMSLMNVVLKSHPVGHTRPIKSKDKLVFHVGFRRYVNQPIFSEHTAGDKQKFCRYFHPGMTVVASMYAPVTYPPAAVLAFRQLSGNRQELVATGSVYTVNADRCVLKRIILSGHPFKIHKRSVVVRYMFFDRDDINWFKPIELRTKWGRKGNIKEALGTHGHMKCVFNGILKSQDTILLHLYKRVFPKWTYNPCVPRCAPLYSVDSLENKNFDEVSAEEDEAAVKVLQEQINERRDKYLMPPPAKKPRKVHFS
ncbi:Ribosome biogenesis protein BMS1/TSR1 C-terminal [Trinorchestia longiramus]|nr:Ribosome biogenesis protein BMS1/TSR1 C-terminal [Trinorchestia longiramus]